MYLITNRKLCTHQKYLDTIVDAAKHGVQYLILREKDLDFDDLEKLYKEIVEVLNKNSVEIKIIVNSSVELYEKYPVYGIHLPYNKFLDMIADGYKFSEDKKIGLSLHSVKEVVELEKIIKEKNIKIEYITLSHIYETKCKEGLKPKGIEMLKDARKFTNIKIVALGGILPENASEVSKFCDDIAVMSTLFNSDNTIKTIKSYMDNIEKV